MTEALLVIFLWMLHPAIQVILVLAALTLVAWFGSRNSGSYGGWN